MKSVCLVACLLSPSVSLAEDVREPIEYRFEDELLKGDLMRPDGEILRVRGRSARATLIEVRSSYLDELTKSIEDL